MRLFTGFIASALLIVAAGSPLSAQVHTHSVCGPPNDSYADGFRAYVINVVTNPKFVEYRKVRKLPAVEASAISFVQSDSICAIAAAVVNKDRGITTAPSDQKVYVIAVGDKFWIEDPTYKAGEYIRGLVLDHEFKSILSRPGR